MTSGLTTLAIDTAATLASTATAAAESTDKAGSAGVPPSMFQQYLTAALLLTGSGFTLLAGIGLIRMPDLYTRMQAAAKAGTLGMACLILSAAAFHGTTVVIALASLIVLFIFLTAPIGSHLIGRSAYFVDVPRWSGTRRDDLTGCYDWDTHRLYPTPEENTGRKDRPHRMPDAVPDAPTG
ncbi:MAG: monovalent cation/H(+) antiporter subunit G [Planctomycetota bacterium]